MFFFGNKFYVIFISIWIIALYFIVTTFHSISNNDKSSEKRIEFLQNELNLLRQNYRETQSNTSSTHYQWEELKHELTRVKRQLIDKSGAKTIPKQVPSLEYEQLRRKIETQARELSYFTNNELQKISEKLSENDKFKWKQVIERFNDQSRVLLASIRNLTNVDGYQSWREYEHKSLSKLMQTRLNSLQNPSKPCTDVKRLICKINKDCGYGCQIHHVMHCFHIAYALGRPMILFSEGWQYNRGGFDQIFQSPSHTCNTSMAYNVSIWDQNETADVIEIPSSDFLKSLKDFMPMAIPEDVSERLIRLHGNPFVWFTGQLMKYLLRPQAWLTQFLEEKYNTLKFETPIVGIHVRRTDKVGTEAAFHDISEYMKYVEDYYIIYKYQNPNINVSKRVYIATDEPLVFDDARTKYPDYIFYGDKSVAKSAQVNSRYGTESLKGVLSDVHFLSLCDYLVCTFSSQICRIAYETMQQRTIDGAWRVQSLDDVYYFGGQHDHQQRAFISHKAVKSKEFSFERGAIISAEGNHWNGFSKGSDKANNQSGLYPSYKTEEIVRIAQMYHYSEINPITGSVQHSPTGLTDACYDKADSHFVTCAQNGNIYVFDRNLDLVKRIRRDGPCHCIAVHKRSLFVGTKANELEVRSFPGGDLLQNSDYFNEPVSASAFCLSNSSVFIGTRDFKIMMMN
ncbi:unnamed protein product [Adineta steineri]|uniref:GT23 domain-containing protein n=1 Tax=Adineta steineri TaxID=433720 RepID=A0A818G2C4_9BILA|nr:unnamed protein product [Adineta steineri]CAF3485004.1 unnamed protein product [Adineta steineri]